MSALGKMLSNATDERVGQATPLAPLDIVSLFRQTDLELQKLKIRVNALEQGWKMDPEPPPAQPEEHRHD